MSVKPKSAPRDAAATSRRILTAALKEFAEHGHGGARLDRIAATARVSKPMIYSYFGDREALYSAALKEAYVQIREGERAIDPERKSPDAAIHELVLFTMKHFISNPWFTSMLNTENLRKGETINQITDLHNIQSPLIEKVGSILKCGVKDGSFRAGIDPTELYIMIASLCFFPTSNKYTLSVVFEVPIDDDWLMEHAECATQMVLSYLRPSAQAQI